MRSLSFLLISVAGAAFAAPPPARVELSYEMLKDGATVAQISRTLQYDGAGYELTESWQPRGLYRLLGSAKRTSRGLAGQDGLRPVEFTDERTGRPTARAHFDWSAMKLTMQYRDPPQTLPLPAHPQDRLSFLLAFVFAPPGAQPVAFDVADGGSISHYVFEVAARERVATPAGEFDAVKLVRRKDGPEDRRSTEIWLAPDRWYVPVRIVATEKDGSRIEQVVSHIAVP
jgi:hypothetical protein